MNKIEQIVYDLALPIAEENNLSIYDIEYKKEGSEYFLRVFIDSVSGVDIDLCEKVSHVLSSELDKADPIKENYYLEVGSPGLDRTLKNKEHFDSCIGKIIEIKLFEKIDGSKIIEGELIRFIDGIITVKTDGEEYSIDKKKASSVRVSLKNWI